MSTPITASDFLDTISEDTDLRRKRTDAFNDRLISRAHWLEPHDRELILAMFRDGHTANTIAVRTRQCPRHTRRTIKRLVARLNDPRVAYVVAHNKGWSRTRRAVARALFVEGRSIREVTEQLGISFYCVRKHRETINAMYDESASKQPLRTWRTTGGSN